MNLSHLFLLTVMIVIAIPEQVSSTSLLNKLSEPVKEPSGSACRETTRGFAIQWRQDLQLRWSDFQAPTKDFRGFAIATASCGFVYDLDWHDGEWQINVSVFFYCHESWQNNNYHIEDVLTHEDLHFDICEVFGRKFYKGVVELREEGNATRRAIWYLYDRLQEEYDEYQDIYDDDTGNSTNGGEQRRWERNIKQMLDDLSDYGNYKEF